MKRRRVIVSLLLVFSFVSSVSAATTEESSASVAVQGYPTGEEEQGTIQAMLEDTLVAGGVKKSGFPYECLDNLLNLTIPLLAPLDPMLTSLAATAGGLMGKIPSLEPMLVPLSSCTAEMGEQVKGTPLVPLEPLFVPLSMGMVDILNLLNAGRENPEAMSSMLVFTLDLISQYPYAIVNLIDLVLSPLTLGVLCHPETWSENYYLQAIASGLKVEDIFLNPVGFCQTFMENSAGYLATWIVGMGMLRLLPTVISQYE